MEMLRLLGIGWTFMASMGKKEEDRAKINNRRRNKDALWVKSEGQSWVGIKILIGLGLFL
ncbi:hypothetical protein RchiOBHm_Chr4g0415971 [Rosa chinensis]|uniref:Uncharacterized protein n=1 Tax=Rosa chinensis TaxID=74649 RepID=A0A2P6QWQ2_ROSCH|nr:hypothetical protein RchiOBHm_Chr4g0415971 [Rosa chinensis]